MTLKKIYILPNILTTANMFCGFFAIIAAIHGNFLLAAWAIMVAMVFDTMDGRIARLTRATSAFGVEYDSLSDLMSFGIAPAIVSYLWCLKPYGRLGWLVAFLYVVCAALRLARFNTRIGLVPKFFFQGAPSPLAAAALATPVIFYYEMEQELIQWGLVVPKEKFILIVMLVVSSLMISTIRFPSFKEFKVKKENSFGVLAVGVLLFILIAIKPEVTLFAFCMIYLVSSVFLDFYRILFRRSIRDKETTLSEGK